MHAPTHIYETERHKLKAEAFWLNNNLVNKVCVVLRVGGYRK